MIPIAYWGFALLIEVLAGAGFFRQSPVAHTTTYTGVQSPSVQLELYTPGRGIFLLQCAECAPIRPQRLTELPQVS